MDLSWMAWTWQTALFFGLVALALVAMTVWELRSPGGGARRGILGIRTTRGDRLFISLLLAAYIHLAWLGFVGKALWPASLASLALAILLFRKG